MEQLTKEHTDIDRRICVKNNRVLVSDELLVALLAIAYKITPDETHIDRLQPIDMPFSIYEESDALTRAINDFYTNSGNTVIYTRELTSWYHEYKRTAYLK